MDSGRSRNGDKTQLISTSVLAQNYPTKPIRLVVGFAPGGSTDVTARIIAERLSTTLGQQVIVDNRAGAGGNIGADIVAKSTPDGYTVLMATTGVMAFNHYLYAKLPYNAEKDLAPVTQIGSLPLILVVPASLLAKSVKELIALAESQPGRYSFGSSGIGGATHVTAELFKALAVPEIKDRMFTLGIEPIGSTPEQFAAHIRAEREKWIPLFKKIGIKPQ